MTGLQQVRLKTHGRANLRENTIKIVLRSTDNSHCYVQASKKLMDRILDLEFIYNYLEFNIYEAF